MAEVRITKVSALETAPLKANLVLVRIDTNQPGLYGWGCATFTQRHKAVVTAIEEYMDQLLRGRDALNVNDAWQVMMNSSYWRNGPVLNNAISGCDMALWDIAGKAANLPVWQLWGGKVREAVPVYRHVGGEDYAQLDEHISELLEQGFQYLRISSGRYIDEECYLKTPAGSGGKVYFDSKKYLRSVPALFEHVRGRFGDEVEFCHDVHERLNPVDALWLARRIEEYRPFFLEDALSPEDGAWFKKLREGCATPLAMGELFNNPTEWQPLIENRWIDYIRCHVSQIGGVTPARKLAAYCEPFGVKTAWHGPGDLSPIGHMANVHLDLTTTNFGIQEWWGMETRPEIREIFEGCAEIRDGFAWANDKPGWGMEVNTEKAKRYPCCSDQPTWLLMRTPDGASAKA